MKLRMILVCALCLGALSALPAIAPAADLDGGCGAFNIDYTTSKGKKVRAQYSASVTEGEATDESATSCKKLKNAVSDFIRAKFKDTDFNQAKSYKCKITKKASSGPAKRAECSRSDLTLVGNLETTFNR